MREAVIEEEFLSFRDEDEAQKKRKKLSFSVGPPKIGSEDGKVFKESNARDEKKINICLVA